MENEVLIEEINSAHISANQDLRDKNFESYAGHFSNDLEYKQLNGRVINKKKLISDISFYFDRVVSSTSEYERLSFQVANDQISERLVQKSKIALRVFIFFSRKWTIEREAMYNWKKNNDKWEISRVEVINEKVY